MKSNWVVFFLNAAMKFFSRMMGTLYEVLSIDPLTYKNGEVWATVRVIWNGLFGCSISLMVIFFFLGLIADVGEVFKNGHTNIIIWTFILFVLGCGIIYAAPYLMLLIFYIGKELMDSVMIKSTMFGTSWVTMPDAIANATNGLSLSNGLIFFLATTVAAIIVVVSCFSIMLVVYGRLFRIYMHIALSPLAFSMAVSSATRHHFMTFIRSFVGVILEGVVIIITCLVFSAVANHFDVNDPLGTATAAITQETDDDAAADAAADAVTNGMNAAVNGILPDFVGDDNKADGEMIWTWLCEQLFLFLLMAGVIKTSDEFVSRKFGF